MKLVYLASTVTLPGSPNRRGDAFEHDQMMSALRGAFEPEGAQVDDIAWDDGAVDWRDYDAAMIGTTWDYADRRDAFLAALDDIARKTQLYNPPSVVRWNSNKKYLRDLEAKGVPIIPTLWLDDANEEAVRHAFDKLNADDLVFKQQVGASARGQYRLRRGEPVPQMPQPMMAQPFLEMIQREGEFSFIFIGDTLSHTLIKQAADGDYRVQSEYGGKETPIDPLPDDKAAAQIVLSHLDEETLYARVDMVRGQNGELLLMELELIEPFLYPLQGPALGPMLYATLKKRHRQS